MRQGPVPLRRRAERASPERLQRRRRDSGTPPGPGPLACSLAGPCAVSTAWKVSAARSKAQIRARGASAMPITRAMRRGCSRGPRSSYHSRPSLPSPYYRVLASSYPCTLTASTGKVSTILRCRRIKTSSLNGIPASLCIWTWLRPIKSSYVLAAGPGPKAASHRLPLSQKPRNRESMSWAATETWADP